MRGRELRRQIRTWTRICHAGETTWALLRGLQELSYQGPQVHRYNGQEKEAETYLGRGPRGGEVMVVIWPRVGKRPRILAWRAWRPSLG